MPPPQNLEGNWPQEVEEPVVRVSDPQVWRQELGSSMVKERQESGGVVKAFDLRPGEMAGKL